MIAVIFEVFPAVGRKRDYLDYAARLKSELECIDGFISVERFQSLTEPDKLLSLSFWRDEEAVASWRSRAGHRTAQSAGRQAIFRDYRLRVAAVIRDCGMSERREVTHSACHRLGMNAILAACGTGLLVLQSRPTFCAGPRRLRRICCRSSASPYRVAPPEMVSVILEQY
jgi:heme-degrading monooxygenase HmoA